MIERKDNMVRIAGEKAVEGDEFIPMAQFVSKDPTRLTLGLNVHGDFEFHVLDWERDNDEVLYTKAYNAGPQLATLSTAVHYWIAHQYWKTAGVDDNYGSGGAVGIPFTFTAPKRGIYQLNYKVLVENVDVADGNISVRYDIDGAMPQSHWLCPTKYIPAGTPPTAYGEAWLEGSEHLHLESGSIVKIGLFCDTTLNVQYSGKFDIGIVKRTYA